MDTPCDTMTESEGHNLTIVKVTLFEFPKRCHNIQGALYLHPERAALTVLLQVLEKEPLGGAELPGLGQRGLGPRALRLQRWRLQVGRRAGDGQAGRRLAWHEVEGDGAAVGLLQLHHVDQRVRRRRAPPPPGVAAGQLERTEIFLLAQHLTT